MSGFGDYLAQAGQGGNLYGAAQQQQVFWGYGVTNPALIDAGAPARSPITLGADQASGYLFQIAQSNPAEYDAYRQRMFNAGLIDKDASGADMQRVWEAALGASATAYAAGTMLAPWDAIDLLGNGTPGGAGREAPFSGTKSRTINSTSTDTNRSVNLSSASEARAFLLAAAERELGRAATSDEIAAFRRALNSEEKANAETTVTTSTRKGTSTDTYVDGDVTASNDNTTSSSNSTTTGGMDRGQFAIDSARSANDYAEYQAATTYMNTLFAALQSPVDVGTN